MSTVGSLTLTAQEQPGGAAYDCARSHRTGAEKPPAHLISLVTRPFGSMRLQGTISPVTSRFYTDHAEAVLGVLVGDARDRPSKHLPVRWLWLRFHGTHRSEPVAGALGPVRCAALSGVGCCHRCCSGSESGKGLPMGEGTPLPSREGRPQWPPFTAKRALSG